MALLLLGGCGEASAPVGIGTRAVVIGIDGADWRVIEALAIKDGTLRRIHYEIHDGGDAFFISCREGSDQHQWDVFDSRIGRWETR